MIRYSDERGLSASVDLDGARCWVSIGEAGIPGVRRRAAQTLPAKTPGIIEMLKSHPSAVGIWVNLSSKHPFIDVKEDDSVW